MKRELLGGINVVSALLSHAPERVIRLWIKQGNPRLAQLAEEARSLGVAIELTGDLALSKQLPNVQHQGVIAEIRPKAPLDQNDMVQLIQSTSNPLILVLDGVQDPQNLGACLRSAAAAGATCVVIPKDKSAELTPTARKASAGASEWFPLVMVTNLARALDELKGLGLWVVGLDMALDSSLFSSDLDAWFAGPTALVMGGEGSGLRQLTAKKCDRLASIPMPGGMESLNVSAAAAVALFAAVRARLSPPLAP